MAAIIINSFVNREPAHVVLPRNLKNADQDSAIPRQPKIWIPSEDDIYVDDERVPKGDFDSKLGEKVDDFLKRPAEANRIVYIASSINVDWGTIVRVVNSARERGVERIGLIVEGNGRAKNRFLLQIPPLRDPNEDLSKVKPNPLSLVVKLFYDQVELDSGAWPLIRAGRERRQRER